MWNTEHQTWHRALWTRDHPHVICKVQMVVLQQLSHNKLEYTSEFLTLPEAGKKQELTVHSAVIYSILLETIWPKGLVNKFISCVGPFCKVLLYTVYTVFTTYDTTFSSKPTSDLPHLILECFPQLPLTYHGNLRPITHSRQHLQVHYIQ